MTTTGPFPLIQRVASGVDAPLLAGMNQHLIADEGHDNPATKPELEDRMRTWLTGGYRGGRWPPRSPTWSGDRMRQGSTCGSFVERAWRRHGIGRATLQLAIERFCDGFIATAIAGVIVLSTGFARADAIASPIVY